MEGVQEGREGGREGEHVPCGLDDDDGLLDLER